MGLTVAVPQGALGSSRECCKNYHLLSIIILFYFFYPFPNRIFFDRIQPVKILRAEF